MSIINTDIVMGLGDDQLSNQWQVTFPEGIPGGGNSDSITLRMDQSFDPPEDVVGTYEIIYRGIKIPKTNKLHDMAKEFTIDIRLDQNWTVFDDLNAWYKLCYDGTNSTALPDLMVRTTMIIQCLDGSNVIKKELKYKGVKPKSVKIGTLDHSSGDPVRVTLACIFNDFVG